MQGNLVQNPLS